MILLALIVLPAVAGVISVLPGGPARPQRARWVCLAAMLADLALATSLWEGSGSARWLSELRWSWIPAWGVSFHLGADGLSLLLVILTAFLGLVSVAASTKIERQAEFFHFNLMLVLSGIIGVFLSLDLFLFYFFWELMLLPMSLLIAIWGHENRTYAAIKFFLFTQASGLLMLLAILGLYYLRGRQTGIYSFDYAALAGPRLPVSTGLWLMLGFFAAFAVKLPVIPFHSWLPDAHTEAPTAGSVVLAGLLLKTGGYGLIRFVVPLFPEAAARLAPVAMSLGVAGILYGALLAFAQTDLKRLVAYTSVSHLGFVLLGVFAGNRIALQGAVIQMICHGLSTGALFVIVGAIQERIHTRDIRKMGGFLSIAPRLSAVGWFFALASLGLPGLGNFVGELLVLLGTYRVSPVLCSLGSLGFVVSTIYSLWLVQTVLHGKKPEGTLFEDFSLREMALLGTMMLALIWIGIYPQPVLNLARPSVAEVAHARR